MSGNHAQMKISYILSPLTVAFLVDVNVEERRLQCGVYEEVCTNT